MARREAYHRATDPTKLRAQPGCRPGHHWRRKRPQEARRGRPDLSNAALVAAVGGAHRHRYRKWSEADEATREELRRRAWSFHDTQRRRTWALPTWCTDDLASRRWWVVLALLVDCYRSGSVGLLVSFEEAAVLFGCSRRTWARWRDAMEECGLLRALPTWGESSEDRGRDRGRNLYQPGPKLLDAAGVGILESTGGSWPQEATRRKHAAQAREEARGHRRAKLGKVWDANEKARQRPQEAHSEAAPEPEPAAKPAAPKGNSDRSAKTAPHAPRKSLRDCALRGRDGAGPSARPVQGVSPPRGGATPRPATPPPTDDAPTPGDDCGHPPSFASAQGAPRVPTGPGDQRGQRERGREPEHDREPPGSFALRWQTARGKAGEPLGP
jgi:hypothetical protein